MGWVGGRGWIDFSSHRLGEGVMLHLSRELVFLILCFEGFQHVRDYWGEDLVRLRFLLSEFVLYFLEPRRLSRRRKQLGNGVLI